jgi:hypothetical protein
MRRQGGAAELTPVQELWDKVVLCDMRRSYDECAALCNNILDLDPDHHDAQFLLGNMYHKGWGVEQHKEKGIELLRASADAGHVRAAALLGACYFGAGDNWREAARLLQIGHDGGVERATQKLGKMYRDGLGVKQDNAKAEQLFRVAFAKFQAKHLAGDIGASFMLANMYFNGEGTHKDTSEGVALLRGAAAAREPDAAYILGKFYLTGHIVRRDLQEALQLFEIAVKEGQPLAIPLLEQTRHAICDTRSDPQVPSSKSARPLGSGGSNACAWCGAKASMSCARCHEAFYCTKACQKNHWKTHKLVCREGKSHLSVVSNSVPENRQSTTSSSVQHSADSSWAALQRQTPIPGPFASSAPPSLAQDDLELAAGVAASMQEADERAAGDNAQVSEHLLHARTGQTSTRICVIEYSRNPKELHQALMTHPDLEVCRKALLDARLDPALPGPSGTSGAKIFVQPELYAGALEAIEIRGIVLDKRHVVVTADLEQVVDRVVASEVPRDRRVKKKGCRSKPPGPFQPQTYPARVKSTFLEVPVPSSMRSAPSSGPRTASTTGLHAGGRNPRQEVSRSAANK